MEQVKKEKNRSFGKLLGIGIIWSSKNIGLAFKTALITSYLTFYCTDVLDMKAALVGSILLGCKLFDGGTDLVAGWLVDNTHTKYGKARPYEWSVLFCGIFTILLFSAPHLGPVGQAVWVAFMYIMTEAIFTTLASTADPIYTLRAFPEEKERNSIYSISVIFGQTLGVALGIFIPQLVAAAGTAPDKWTKMVLMTVGPTALLGMIRFFFVKEKNMEAQTETRSKRNKQNGVGVRTGLRAIAKNKYIMLLMLMIIVIIIASGVLNTSATYYFKYFIGDISKMSVVNISLFSSVLMLIIFVPLANKFGKCRVLQASLALSTLGCVIRVIGGTNLAALTVGMALLMFGIMPISIYFPLYLFDIIDYGEWKTGERVEGMLASLPAFATKVANGLSISLGSLILGAAGYDGKLDVQSETAMRAINLNYNIIPLVCMIIMTTVSLVWFNMDKVMPTVKKELAERHAAAGENSEAVGEKEGEE